MIMTLHGKQLADLLPTLLSDTRHSLRLTMYQLSPPTAGTPLAVRKIWEQIEAATDRGISCSAYIYNGGNNSAMTGANEQAAERLRTCGWVVRMSEGAKIMHAKQLVIDFRSLLIGSHNWTTSGLIQNHEASILLKDCPAATSAGMWHDKLMEEG